MEKSANKFSSGFTLIEFLFATVLISVMLTIVLTTFIGVFRFYVWSSTTRNNQSYTRDLLDSIGREVRSHKIYSATTSEICLSKSNPSSIQKTEKIYLQNNKVLLQEYSGDNCTSPLIGVEKSISNPALSVNQLDFLVINGALNSDSFISAHPEFLRKSVTINLKVTNGILVSGACAPTDPFCDQVQYVTAENENNSSF